MKKLIIALMTLGVLGMNTAFAQENCPSVKVAKQKYGINKSPFLLQERAEEFEYNYYKLPKPVNGRNYIMLLELGDCLYEAPTFISDKEFNKIKKAHDLDKSRRVVNDGEGE